MKKKNELLKTEISSSVYKKIKGNIVSVCGWCMPNKGCNKWHKKNSKNWKSYRKTQWK